MPSQREPAPNWWSSFQALSGGLFTCSERINPATIAGMGKLASLLTLALVILCSFAPSNVPKASAQATKALLLYGGDDHDVFLGCLNCTNQSPSSVCNDYGKYGSEYQSNSIWNAYGMYGSEYNTHSPWNQYITHAPIIVDKDGGSYGYFSANAYHHDRTRIDWIVKLLDFQADKDDLEKTKKMLCGDE
jgi:hypothetical protein